ncbi:MAG: AzlD domain-containing protein [Acidimicrobiales bacterium]|jgi:hypothetical protein|nr:AzlD domain-containing protein [Acidimicrobiales bacterium]MDP6901948.1 AzlD domain-containing protein [Acidimicrobiales bacterium]HJL98334.1 AzlD domain-containing protein [Acidimicrobiales bacterium]
MTWWLLGGLVAGCYFFKISGVLAAGTLRLSGSGQSFLVYLTPAVLSGLIIVQTFDGGGSLTVGALTAGVITGAAATWMKAPLPAVLLVASATTAVIRLL